MQTDPHTTAIAAGRVLAALINGSEAAAIRRGVDPRYAPDPIPAHQREGYNAPGGLLSMSSQRRMLAAVENA